VTDIPSRARSASWSVRDSLRAQPCRLGLVLRPMECLVPWTTPPASPMVDRARGWSSEASMSAPTERIPPLGRALVRSSGVLARILSIRGAVTSSLPLPPMRLHDGSVAYPPSHFSRV
jgi:hypothetical protein